MKVKFNRYERIAGIFVLTAVLGSVAALIGVAVKKGWFEAKVKFSTTLKNAEGIREGTVVQLAGLRAGSVTEVDLRPNNEIFVRLEIAEKYHDRIRQDSVVRAIRPFVIGEKVLEVTVGSDELPRLAINTQIRSEPTMDLMDLISGKSLGPYVESIGKLTDNLKVVIEALLDPRRAKSLISMLDDLQPLVRNVGMLSRDAVVVMRDVNKDKRIVRLAKNLDEMTTEVAKILPMITEDSPELAGDMKTIAKNLAVLTDELRKSLPILQELGPEVPRASRRAMEALDETVVTLKAMQKSFLLRGNVREVREEEAGHDKTRLPANESNTETKK